MLRTKVKRVSLSGGIVASVLCLVSPVQALQVQVTPANPELGDTLSVINQVNNSPTPTVSVQPKTIRLFQWGTTAFGPCYLQPLEQDLSAKSKSPVMDKCRS